MMYCSTGDGAQYHIYVLTLQDELYSIPDYIYISCQNSNNNNQTFNASVKLEVNVTDMMENRLLSINNGISDSELDSGIKVNSNKLVYLTDINNNQVMARTDKLVESGNNRWIIDYIHEDETRSNLFNITPSVYSLELWNMTLSRIKLSVEVFINNTID